MLPSAKLMRENFAAYWFVMNHDEGVPCFDETSSPETTDASPSKDNCFDFCDEEKVAAQVHQEKFVPSPGSGGFASVELCPKPVEESTKTPPEDNAGDIFIRTLILGPILAALPRPLISLPLV